ncbi:MULTISPECIES: HAD family hydrolase [Mycolicibacterium]|uniref:HAD family hydrolase n=2 Tax=Mycolicibacterium phocaicum TaxID=319706 RepID=A0A7I7ZKH1_9MYCO|nr:MULTISPECIES: HAD family phosphatase [Mycolicibacterium]TXH17835.1 MAG: HAD family phosphatase [Mycobacterium sp.]SHV96648.1 HAD superfamily hydrolase [Mycobacteroides abscessus subsp. abscessus]MDX1881431.1 HAD family phosphatase [Mycolicibacterium sp. 141076]TLH70518.1 HAD family hydrolase [Mycolicibacterium phocaicum]UCZ62477.1 HAD family phosphatase [Mycolicibacterium phocaicum]
MFKAVLFDMDGTLVDSEKLWDVAMHAFYAQKGGVLTDAVRETTVGGSAENVMRIVYDDLGLDPTPESMAESADWLHVYTGELFEQGLPWRPGAQELLETLAASEIPLALVTNTRRTLTEQALKTIGSHYFTVTVCGDEVPDGKPHPAPYLRAAELLGVAAEDCLAIEDSVTGAQSADAAGCVVLVVPNDVAVPDGPRRRHIESLAGLGVADLRDIYTEMCS